MWRFPLCLTVVTLTGLITACGDDAPSTPSPISTPAASEDERGSIGAPPMTRYDYCTKSGNTVVDERCQFPDGTSCELWAFYRAECGQPFSYCNTHGGAVSKKTEGTSISAVCDLDGKQCKESSFAAKGVCD